MQNQLITGLILTQIGTLLICLSGLAQVWSMWRKDDPFKQTEHHTAAGLAAGIPGGRKKRWPAAK